MSDNPSKPSDNASGKQPLGHFRLNVGGLLFGLACVLVFDEPWQPLLLIREASVKLLQVTVRPSITLSLLLGIGSLTGTQAREVVHVRNVLHWIK